MIPKDPVYLLTKAVERVRDTIPDQAPEDWLKDAIAADHVELAYVVWEEDKGLGFQSFITILPSAVIIEVPDLKIDWLKGTVTVHDRRGFRGHPALRSISGPPGRRLGTDVEYPIVVSRRDLDRELANTTTPQENDDRPEYTPPYLAFMHRATQEMSLQSGTRTPKKTIKVWLRENWPDQLGDPTKNKIERMATFLRHPEDELGGHFKPNRDE